MLRFYNPDTTYSIIPENGGRSTLYKIKSMPVVDDMSGEYLGVVPVAVPIIGAITGIFTAITGTAAIIISAVQRKRAQEAAAGNVVAAGEYAKVEQAVKLAETVENAEKQKNIGRLLIGIGIPAAIVGTALIG